MGCRRNLNAKDIRPRERDIQRQILDWLRLKRIFHYRQNVGAQKIGTRYVRYGVPGLPDIVVVKDGVYIGLEVKTAKIHEQSVSHRSSLVLN